MDAVSSFDWIRWVDVPVLIGMAAWLMRHAIYDHQVEVEIKSKIANLEGAVEGLEGIQTLLLKKELGVQDDGCNAD
jgi:hypothetical protein